MLKDIYCILDMLSGFHCSIYLNLVWESFIWRGLIRQQIFWDLFEAYWHCTILGDDVVPNYKQIQGQMS